MNLNTDGVTWVWSKLFMYENMLKSEGKKNVI